MNRRGFILRCLLGLGMISLGKLGLDELLLGEKMQIAKSQQTRRYYRIVVFGDPHLPVRMEKYKEQEKQQQIIALKNKVIDAVNLWDDVDQISVVGDIAARYGIEEEYAFAQQYFARLQKPVYIIGGNHDYRYKDELSARGRLQKGTPASMTEKLELFRTRMRLESLYYAQQLGKYRLLYLTPDATGKYLTEISGKQFSWLETELSTNINAPTIIFFHAPLFGTLSNYNKDVNTPDFIPQIKEKLDALLVKSPQVLFWVSGHTHTPVTNAGYADSSLNTYANHIVDIHNTDMDRTTIWTNSLYLYDDKLVVRTYDHKQDSWKDSLERTFFINI